MTSLLSKIAFLKILITRLHQYGASAGRLEAAINDASKRLDLKTEVLASATGVWFSVDDPERPHQPITHVLRLPVGSIHLALLAQADKIAYDVAEGRMGIEEGLQELTTMKAQTSWWRKLGVILCCGLVSMSVPTLFEGTGYVDLISSFLLGVLCGVIVLLGGKHWRIGEATEALAGFFITLGALAINSYVAGVSVYIVMVAGLIALMPGLALTTALAELSSGQLMAGMGRMGGALTSILKLSFGAALAFGVAKLAHFEQTPHWNLVLSPEVRLIGLIGGSLAFAGLFHAAKRDILLVAGSVLLGHFVAHFSQTLPENMFGILPVGAFVGSALMTTLGNIYSSVFHRPGAIIRVPGIIMLVPGSIGFKAGTAFWENQVAQGQELLWMASLTIVALVAGILIGNLLMPARRKL